MKKMITRSLLLTPIVGLAFPMVANAATCGTDSKGNPLQTSFDFHCSGNGANSVSAILLTVINFMAVGVGLAVVGGIIWGGITYITSDGNAAKAQQGVVVIINSVVGLLLFIFMWALINFLVPGGVFS